jgi:hypothetical protein
MPLADGVSFIAASAGTGAFAYGSSRASFMDLAQAVTAGELVDGQTVSYLAQDSLSAPTQREWGRGTFHAAGGGSITRTSPFVTVNGNTVATGTPLNFTTAPYVSPTVLAEDLTLPALGGRTVLTGNLSLYVSTTGSDSNDGLTTGTAFATVQHALDLVAENYFLFYANVFILIQAGSGYDGWIPTQIQTALVVGATDGALGPGPPNMKGFVVILGDTSDNTAVTISGQGGLETSHYGILGGFTSVVSTDNFIYSVAAVSFDSLTIDCSKYEFTLVSGGPNVVLYIGGGYSHAPYGIISSSGVRFLPGPFPMALTAGGVMVINTALFFEAGDYTNGIIADNGCSVYAAGLTSITAENGATWTNAFVGLDDDVAGGLVDLIGIGSITDSGAVGSKFAVNGPNALLTLPGDLSILPGDTPGIISNNGSVVYQSDVDSNFYTLGANCTEAFTVATLPAAPLAYQGMRAFVSDATAPVFGSAPVGTGGTYTPVIYLNGAWQVG